MAKRNPFFVTFPERETRNALSLVVSNIARSFQRGDSPKLMMMTDRQASNLRQDGWGVVSAIATGDEPASEAVPAESTTEPKPRRSRRREE